MIAAYLHGMEELSENLKELFESIHDIERDMPPQNMSKKDTRNQHEQDKLRRRHQR